MDDANGSAATPDRRRGRPDEDLPADQGRAAPGATSPGDPLPLSPWPAVLLAAAACLVLGPSLWLGGFEFNPLLSSIRWAARLSPFIALGVAVRWAAGVLRRRAWAPLPARDVARHATSLATCALALGAMSAAYTWGKGLVPWFNPRTWDAELRAIDLALHFDLDLNVAFLALMEPWPTAELVVDWGYQHFYHLILLSLAWLLTTSDFDSRHRLLRGQVMLWLSGLALYLLLPSVGPVFILNDLFVDISERFPRNAFIASLLSSNYQDVLRLVAGENVPVNVVLGTAAMPSLHVAMPAYCTLHCHERGSPLRTFYALVTGATLFAAVVTGWHYAIDGYVGIALAVLAWLAVRVPPAGRPGAASPRHASPAGEPASIGGIAAPPDHGPEAAPPASRDG